MVLMRTCAAALLCLCLSGPAAAQKDAAGSSQENISWHAPACTATAAAVASEARELPEHFWAYLEHALGVGPKQWDGLSRNAQVKLIEKDRQSGDSGKVHQHYAQAKKLLEDALKAVPSQAPAQKLETIKEAERKLSSPLDLIRQVEYKLGPKYGKELLKLRDTLTRQKEGAHTLLMKERTQKIQEQGSLKGAKEAEKRLQPDKTATGKQKALDKLFEDRAARQGELEPAADKAKKQDAAQVRKEQAGGDQLRKGAAISETAQKKYAKEVKAPPSPSFPQGKIPGGLRVDKLKERGYSDQNIQDLSLGIANTSGAVGKLHQEYPSAVAGAYGSGTMTNVEDSFKGAGSGIKHSVLYLGSKVGINDPPAKEVYALKRGCVSHQGATLEGAPKDTSIEYKPVMIGKVMEHHAVVAYPKPPEEVRKDPARMEEWWKSKGVVLDGWKYQSAAPEKMTFGTVEEWKNSFLTYRFMGPRLE